MSKAMADMEWHDSTETFPVHKPMREKSRRSRRSKRGKKVTIFRKGKKKCDVTNLCADNFVEAHLFRCTNPMLPPSVGSLRHDYPGSLYPQTSQVESIKPLQKTEDLFARPTGRRKTARPKRDYSFRRSYSSRSSRIGAFAESGPADDMKNKSAKPPPPTWVNQSSGSSSSDHEYKSDSSSVSSRAKGSYKSDGRAGYYKEDSFYNKKKAWRPQGKREEVEVSPGNYMELRGSDETMDAVMNGEALVVECFSCQLQLQCVSDADYVICPDCRVLTPIQRNTPEEDDHNVARHASDSGKPSARQKRDHHRDHVGGLGLGLRMDSR